MTDFTNKRLQKLAGLLEEQVDLEDDEPGLDAEKSSLPSDVMTVGKLKKLLAGLPDDMPVITDHEYGYMDAGLVAEDNYYYKPEKWGGGWHWDRPDGIGPFKVVVIKSQ